MLPLVLHIWGGGSFLSQAFSGHKMSSIGNHRLAKNSRRVLKVRNEDDAFISG